MELEQPAALALALLAVPLAYLARRGRRPAIPIATLRGLDEVRPGARLRAARVLPLLRVLALVALAVAIARPRIGDANAVVPGEGIDIVLSLDISSSMETSLAAGKSRLETARDVIREFIKGRENDRIGLVVFQRDAIPLSPPSLDYEALDRIVEETNSGLLPDGTGIGVGIAEALNMLRQSAAASRVVILLTDGAHNAASIPPEDASALAAALRIRVYTIGIVPIDTRFGTGDVDEDRLKAISERTGAAYFAASSEADLAAVYEEIGRLETSRVGREGYERFTELGPLFALAAGGLLVSELLARATVLRMLPA